MSQFDDNRRKHDDLRAMVDQACKRVTNDTDARIKDAARRAYYLGCRDGMELAREHDKQPRKLWILGRQYDLSKGDDVKAIGEVIGNCQDRQAPNDLALIASTLLSAALEG
jgi:hypothetical protein